MIYCFCMVVQPWSLLQPVPQFQNNEPLRTEEKITLKIGFVGYKTKCASDKHLTAKVSQNLKLPVKQGIPTQKKRHPNSIFFFLLCFDFKSLFSALLFKLLNAFHFDLHCFGVIYFLPKPVFLFAWFSFCDVLVRAGFHDIYIDSGRGWSFLQFIRRSCDFWYKPGFDAPICVSLETATQTCKQGDPLPPTDSLILILLHVPTTGGLLCNKKACNII